MKGSHCGEHCWQEGKYMKNLQIGKSGIEVPFLGMGTWAIGGGAWWGDNDDSLSVKAIQTAVEQGIRWIDTAPIYGLYHSEEVVGEAMKHIDRDKVVLSTKCGLEWRHKTPVLHKVVDGVTVYPSGLFSIIHFNLHLLITFQDQFYIHHAFCISSFYCLLPEFQSLVLLVARQFSHPKVLLYHSYN